MHRILEKVKAFGKRRLVLMGMLPSVMAAQLHAESAPWDTPLERLEAMLTGSTIRIVGILLILSAGLFIAVSEGSGVKKRVAWIVIGLGIAVNAAAIIDKVLS